MRGYDRNDVDEYDEYEDEGEEHYEEDEEGEEEEDEVEEQKPTEEELEYLELRRQLKERYRKNIKKENGLGMSSSQEKKNRLPNDNYGSFFGPSQPVISQRVIQESKSLLETQHLACRVPNSHRNNEKTFASSASKVGVQRPPPKVNAVQRKVQKLKVSRDYSFLSDDAELPAPKKEPPAPKKDPPARNVSVPNSEARLAQVPPKSKQPVANSSRNLHSAREERKPVSSNGQMHSKAGLYKSATGNKSNLMSMDSRKQHSSNNGIGPGRPAGQKVLPSRMPVASMEKKAFAPAAKNQLPSAKMPPSSKALPPVQKKHLEQRNNMRRNGIQESKTSQPISKQLVASSKPQAERPINKPVKQTSSYATTQDHRPKKKPLKRYSDDEGDDDAMAFTMLRSMLGPRKFASYDDDDSDMEAGFDDIMAEERRSAKIARKEDEEQLRLIEEEERQERMRKLAKKRKLMSQR
ncbi:Protein SPT2-like [Melia azedarach]|uniref:Protein SPT2-like n=1 Tax=Melia azedarach TaxID=155640 RepID=A0ACC1XT51_MELAZ|nr:Protein SPT2-like [Melia azedarach]